VSEGAVEPFTVRAAGCTLSARSYRPAEERHPGCAAILVHGLLASSAIFDVPGLEELSLARRLQNSGVHVISYDQRGAGDSTTDQWGFGLRAHALVDLPAVVAACAERLAVRHVLFLAHSLGGTIWLRYLQSLAGSLADAAGVKVVGGAVLASPAVFDRRDPPWSTIAARGMAFIDRMDHDHDGIVSREEFTGAQITLSWPWAAPFVRPSAVRASTYWAGRSRIVAGLLRRLPIPTLIYHRDDFDDAVFSLVLKSRALHRGSHALMRELMQEILDGPEHRPVVPSITAFPALCIGSALDGLVPLKTVEAFGRQFAVAHVIATETAYGHPSGHAGYFFKKHVESRVFDEVRAYVTQRFAAVGAGQ